MRSKSARRWWLDPTPVVRAPTALGLLMAACASLHNTPAQDLAWNRWTACHTQISGTDIRTVQLDGRILFWSNGTADGLSMVDCLAQAGKNGPALPEPLSEIRPKGAG
jgi:hypothetical protein